MNEEHNDKMKENLNNIQSINPQIWGNSGWKFINAIIFTYDIKYNSLLLYTKTYK